MRKRAITVFGATVAAFLLTTTTASADSIISAGENNIKWRRGCDTVYSGAVAPTYAVTIKKNNGSCEGHAWLRVHATGTGWTAWVSDSTDMTLESPAGRITRAQHKGCKDCTVYSTELRELD